ncbi:MAG: glucose-6-phosphate dehydrogenase [Streptococcaceae bacterium]|nr:glucose-6-phosphate dehydrogenase [Streptococcaceae bacterium]
MTESKQVLFTIFGATGDLAQRKLYPSLFRLYLRGQLAEHFAVIGTARREWTNEFYRDIVKASIVNLVDNEEKVNQFISHFYYQSHDVTDAEHYQTLKNLGQELKAQYQTADNQVFYLAMAPQFFSIIANQLQEQGILTGKGFERVIIEKPFGTDYDSAKALNDSLGQVFNENQIFRIDHYLGKEMIQSVSAVRFANTMFESLWNNRHIDNIQITFAEAIGVEDRGGYYETSGALKDMIQNHVLQVLSLLAMEKPAAFTEEEILKEKVNALQAIKKYTREEALKAFIPGQYIANQFNGKDYISYHDEPNVAPNSTTETFVAGKFLIENDRWSGVPFYVRSGKRLTEKGTRINIIFKQDKNNIFNKTLAENILTLYIQPTEGFSLSLNGKEVGNGFDVSPLKLEYRHDSAVLGNSPEAYEKLILDVLNGDGTNFSHWEEVARSWELIDVIRQAWDSHPSQIPTYLAGSMGPEQAFQLLEKEGCSWIWQPDLWYKENENK